MLIGTMGLIFLLCGIGLVCWSEWATSTPPGEHSDDCVAWSAGGLTDPHCTAPHTTDHFASTRTETP